jgi:hypothetical protein
MSKRKQTGTPLKDDTVIAIYVDKKGNTVIEEKAVRYRTLRAPKRKRKGKAA